MQYDSCLQENLCTVCIDFTYRYLRFLTRKNINVNRSAEQLFSNCLHCNADGYQLGLVRNSLSQIVKRENVSLFHRHNLEILFRVDEILRNF